MQFPFQLLPDADFDVVGFGTNAVDHLISVPKFPEYDSKIEYTSYEREAGGEVATTMVGLTRLGSTAAYVGRFGSDEEGTIGLRSLAEAGVDISYAEVISGASTQTAFIVIDERTGERTIIWHRDNKLAYGRSDAPLAMASRGKILHLTPHDTAACVEMARVAKKNRVIVSIDIDNVFDGIEELLPLVDIFTASSSFGPKFIGATDERAVLSAIKSRFGCPITGITRGSLGSIFFCEGVFFESQAFDVPDGCKDTTGAGDAFRVGLLHGLLTGESLDESAKLANAVAALKCRELGARKGLPTREELNSLLKKI